MNDTLQTLRKDINEIDSKILILLTKRRRICHSIVEHKMSNNKPIRDEKRELSLLENLISYGRSLGLDAYYVNQVFQIIIQDSVLQQQAMLQKSINLGLIPEANKVAYVGEQSSVSQLACHKYFSRRSDKFTELDCKNYSDVVNKVENGQANYGLLLLENSGSGGINEVYGLLEKSAVAIIGELNQPAEYCLIAPKNTEYQKLTIVYGQPPYFTQWNQFLKTFNNMQFESCESTLSAINQVKKVPYSAAIIEKQESLPEGFEILESTANTSDNNNRFLVIAKNTMTTSPKIPTKTALIISTNKYPGALVDALMIFKDYQINLIKLEFIPLVKASNKEVFFVDLDANLIDSNTQQALEALKSVTESIKILGSYPSESLQAVDIKLTDKKAVSVFTNKSCELAS